jgi:hypothetical protein
MKPVRTTTRNFSGVAIPALALAAAGCGGSSGGSSGGVGGGDASQPVSCDAGGNLDENCRPITLP